MQICVHLQGSRERFTPSIGIVYALAAYDFMYASGSIVPSLPRKGLSAPSCSTRCAGKSAFARTCVRRLLAASSLASGPDRTCPLPQFTALYRTPHITAHCTLPVYRTLPQTAHHRSPLIAAHYRTLPHTANHLEAFNIMSATRMPLGLPPRLLVDVTLSDRVRIIDGSVGSLMHQAVCVRYLLDFLSCAHGCV